MARKRASMREGPLAELFRATEAAQRGSEGDEPVDEPLAARRRGGRPADPDPRRAAGAGDRLRCRAARKLRSRRPSST